MNSRNSKLEQSGSLDLEEPVPVTRRISHSYSEMTLQLKPEVNLYSVQSVQYTGHYIHCQVYNIQYTTNCTHCKLKTAHCKLQTSNYSLVIDPEESDIKVRSELIIE